MLNTASVLMVSMSNQVSAEEKILLLHHNKDDRKANLQLRSSDQMEGDTTVITTITKCYHLLKSKGKYLSKSYLLDYPKIPNISM